MLVDCGDKLFVGDYAACDAGGFDWVIHLWRERDVAAQAACKAILGGGPAALKVRWTEEGSLGDLDPGVPAIIEFARRPGRLLVHCRSGHCRSCNLAVLAAVARGMDAFGVMDRLNRERFAQVGGVPAWNWIVLNEILSLRP